MKPTTKFIFLHPFIHKQPGTTPHHLYLFTFLFLLFLALTFFLFTTLPFSATTTTTKPPLPKPVFDALLHYATITTNSTNMSAAELTIIAAVLRRCSTTTTCNLLVFRLTPETLLYHALNINCRTTFVDENAYFISKLEEKNPSIEAYDVQFTTKVCDLDELIRYAKSELRNECRPV